MDAAMVTDKERGADLIFQISNAAAYGGFLDVQRLGRTSETAEFGGSNYIAEMTQFDRQAAASLMSSPRSFGLALGVRPAAALSEDGGTDRILAFLRLETLRLGPAAEDRRERP